MAFAEYFRGAELESRVTPLSASLIGHNGRNLRFFNNINLTLSFYIFTSVTAIAHIQIIDRYFFRFMVVEFPLPQGCISLSLHYVFKL